MDWLDVLAVQGTLKSLLQHHTSKAYVKFKNKIKKKQKKNKTKASILRRSDHLRLSYYVAIFVQGNYIKVYSIPTGLTIFCCLVVQYI